MDRKSSPRTSHFPTATSSQAQLVARFRQQMADHARGERLKSLRTDRRLNQEDAAHEIGVSTKTLRTWEKGGPIKWENAKAAATFYEVEAESLVEREPGTSIATLAENPDQLNRIERKLDEILDYISGRQAERVARSLGQDEDEERRKGGGTGR